MMLLLGLSVASLLCAAAFVAGDALDGEPAGPPSAAGTGGPAPAAIRTPNAEPAAAYRPRSARDPRVEAGPTLLGPGDTGREVRDLQARLRQIGWFDGPITGTYRTRTTSAVRGFQAKRGIPVTGAVDRRTLDRLHAMTGKPTQAELHNRPNPAGTLDPRCRIGRVLCIDKTAATLRWVVDGRVRQTLDARFGAASTPTREGSFHVYVKSIDHVSRLYGSPMPFAMFFSGGQAVHYSSDFAAVGYAGASHGCVNIRDYAGIRRLFGQVRIGDAVIVYRS